MPKIIVSPLAQADIDEIWITLRATASRMPTALSIGSNGDLNFWLTIRRKETGSAVQGPSLYDQDFAEWVQQQVRLLCAGLPNLIEELEGLTKRDQRALGSQLKRIMAHMLKQRYQPQRASRRWVDWIENGREEIADILEQSPSLRRTLPGLMSKNYPRAVAQASRDTRLPIDRFPAQPPFTLEGIPREQP